MARLALLPNEEEEKPLLLAQLTPRVVLNFEMVRKQVDKQIPDEVVNQIVASQDRKKIAEVNSAAKSIRGYTKEWADATFSTLEDEYVAKLFVKKTTDFVELTKRTDKYALAAFDCMRLDIIGEAFDKDPQRMINIFERLAKSEKDGHGDVFTVLHHVDAANFLLEHEKEFLKLTDYNGKWGGHAVRTVLNEQTEEVLGEYLKGQRTVTQLSVAGMSLINGWAIELGRPLDYLHDNPAKREEYLNSISFEQVLGLVCSNPEFFYTSTNHMLFDKLKKGLENRTVDDLKKEYRLTDTQVENLIFRAINYDRLVGKEDSLFSKKDIPVIRDVLFKRMNENKFDEKYYYLFANGIEKIGSQMPGTLELIEQKIDELKKKKEGNLELEKIYYSLVYIRAALKKDFSDPELKKLEERKNFKPSEYVGKDGKTHVLQVFDKEDTEKDHWEFSKKWFEKMYGKPKTGNDGELIYGNGKVEVVLYMGQTKDKNKDFAKKWVNENETGIITFRGHSYNLEKNMPHEIFQNRQGKYVFIPGSCGSAGSTPEYIVNNPKTDLRFFSNTSTGRGQVTNALVSALLAQSEPIPFAELINKNKQDIERNGGDIRTIKVENMGERMLYYLTSRLNTE